MESNIAFGILRPLEPWESSGPTVLKLASADPARIVFENPSDGKPKRVIFTHTGPDTYMARSEIVSDTGRDAGNRNHLAGAALLVAEVADTGKHHRHPELVGRRDHILIPYDPPG